MASLTSVRRSGVLLHPTSLPGPYGMGDLGSSARRFVDWLQEARQQLWQVLPLNPTAHGNSPYAAPSAFAGNTHLISVEGLLKDGLLTIGDINNLPPFPRSHVDFGAVTTHRAAIFDKAFAAFQQGKAPALKAGLEEFRHAQGFWLEDHALFNALHQTFNHQTWPDWDPAISRREKAAMTQWKDKLRPLVDREVLLQFLFARQWKELRQYANSKGVSLVGDIPIFVAFDSADAWAAPHLFKLDEKGNRLVLAGVPPDYFSEDGQLWGNPLYRWDVMEKDGYAWWVARARAIAAQVDIIRVDHFRGFCAAWEVPAGARTARKGKWVKGPGRKVFDAIGSALGNLPFIAEDLGIITPDVEALRDGLDLPGMRILQFAFGDTDGINNYLPHNFTPNTVVYTGTHDNDTTRGWWEAAKPIERSHLQVYLSVDGNNAAWDLVRAAWSSVAGMAIAPMQDLLNLPTSARINVPGQAEGNWSWRFTEDALSTELAQRLAHVTTLYARHPGAQRKREAEKREAALKETST